MFGCAAVVTVPAVVALPAVATFKFATWVVEVTVNGAVPVATFDTSVLAVTAPLTPSDVNVPTLVILGCAAVVTVPAVVADVAEPAAATFKLATCVVEVTVNGAVPVATFDTKVEAVTVPLTPSDVSVPTLVILGCAAVVTVPAVVAEVADPAVATFKFATCVVDVTVNGAVPVATFDISVLAVTEPLTPNDVSVPTEVMFGCAAVVTVPAVVADVAVPAVATFKFATCVVDVTMNGAVPVAMFDLNTVALA